MAGRRITHALDIVLGCAVLLKEAPAGFRVANLCARHHIPLLIGLDGSSTHRGG